MKPLLVAADFSEPSDNAAQYALQLAISLKSNLCLCHAYRVDTATVGRSQWPVYEGSTQDVLVISRLQELAKVLSTIANGSLDQKSFKPMISWATIHGEVGNAFSKLFKELTAGIIVIGVSVKVGDVSSGSFIRQMVGSMFFPVLLVPQRMQYAKIRKIAFATDLSESDIEVVVSLASLAAHLAADLVVTHVIVSDDHDADQDNRSERFIEGVSEAVSYRNIHYRVLKQEDIDEGLDWLLKNGEADMLAIVHRKRSNFYRFFLGSHVLKLAANIKLPTLVLPADRSFSF